MNLISKICWKLLPKKQRNLWLDNLHVVDRAMFSRLLSGKNCDYPESFKKLDCIFVHIPKAAGTSVLNCLMPGEKVDHLPLSWYQSLDSNYYRDAFKFGFVRNPWDRLVSSFHYQIEKTSHRINENEWVEFLKTFESFDDFVTKWVNEENIYRHVLYVPQTHFINNKFGVNGLDFTGRFENLADDFDYICERLHIENTSLTHQNKSNRIDYRNYYTDKTIDIVAKAYRKDIETLGYSFE
jgi:hypothetical protein